MFNKIDEIFITVGCLILVVALLIGVFSTIDRPVKLYMCCTQTTSHA